MPEGTVGVAAFAKPTKVKATRSINKKLYLCIRTTLEKHYLVFIFVIYVASLFGEKGKVDRLDFFVILEYALQLRVNKNIETHAPHHNIYKCM